KCIISNAGGSVISSEAVLKVILLPEITSQPEDIAARDGDTVTFSITATGTAPLRYKWLKNGIDSISASSSVTLNGIKFDDDGSFFICELTNTATDLAKTVIRSDTAYLTVAPAPPLITEQPQHVTVEEGKNAVFRIKVTGTPPFAYSWYKDGGTEVSDADSLVVKDVTKSDSGTSFICVVVNSAGAVTSDTAILHVGNVEPKINKNPTDYEIHEGGTAVFTAKATGTAELIYTWYLKETGDSVGSGDTLKLKNVSKSDSGNVYYCVIRNKEGQAETEPAVLHVLDALAAPEITLHPVSQAKYVGDSVTFSVNATGNPAPEYQWYKNGLPVTGQTGKSLKLTNIKLSDDSSKIYCVVYNSEDSVFSDTAILTIIPPPIAGFSVEPIAGFVPLTVSFADTSQGEITSRKWYFGDGDSSTQRNPKHVYETAGKFQVKLVVTNPSGKDSTSDTITVFAEGANPVVITASYLKDRDIRIVLKNLSAIEDAFPSAWVDSLGIWVEEEKLPTSPSTSVRLKAYSKKKLIDAGDSFVDTLTLPDDGDLYGLMNALIFLDRSNSEFDSLNGCMVFMKDTIHPDNPLSISGSHLGGDSAQIRFGNVSSIDDEKADSIGFWYGTDTSSLSFSSSNSQWFSVDEITGESQYAFKISDELFNEEAVEIWLAVVIKGTNGLLSPVVKSSFSTSIISVDNPIILSAVALSASRIMLSWPKIDDQEVTRIRLWKGEKAVPDGPVIPTGFDSVGVSPSDTIYIFTSLKSETRYYFGAQVFKDGKWSPVTSNARASAVTLEPSDTTRVENCIRLDPPVFDTLSATISLSWCLDSSCYMDDLDVGISYSNVHFPELKLYIGQIVEVTSECQSVVLKLKENTSILFDTTYYIELWLRKTDGEWSNPTELSKAVVRTLPFTREIVTFFRPGEDTVKAFNSTVVLWKDKSFPSTALTTDTIAVFKPGRSYKGMIPVGTGFSFMKKQPTPAFFVGLRYTELPKGYSADDVRIYRDNGSTLILEHGTIVDSNSKTLAVKTSDLRYPFILLIDTMPPVVTFRDTGSIAESERTLRDTIGLEDNISNLYWKYIYGKGNEAPSYEKLDTLEGESETIRLSVSSDLKVISQDYGLRAYLIVSDGAHVDTFNLSRRVRRDKSDPIRTTAKEWYPLKVTSELTYTSPESVIVKLLEKDVEEYDNRYIRMFRWVDDGRNESSDRWVEYADSNSSLFKFIPG
ncbi:MAG TPA: immunoglobulin domain-containing protein, partial [Chitinispirillaceae bacterium]|nr:immunoglobulin domain-containing protein [Chitinispirillaceae bacterium]